MTPAVSAPSEAVRAGADAAELEFCPLAETYRAAFLRAGDQELFAGLEDKDVRRSVHIGDVPMPELAPDEVLVAVVAAAVNYNTVWSATFEPVPTFRFLRDMGRRGGWDAAARSVPLNAHAGKVGVLALAPREGLGVEDPLLRGQIGEERLRILRDHADDSASPCIAGI